MTLFAGGGEMGALMRAKDWSATPLGPPDTWPQSLRAVIRIVLTSRYAMWMSWGPELTFFYNDAYGAMTLGAKHPWALGRPSQEVWAEIWPQIGPRIERVLTTGEATWDERLLLFLERSGYTEETYHTFSYSPLADDDGAIRGHLCVVTEETSRVIDERRLALLKELGGELATAKTEEDVFRAAERAIGSDRRPLPFTLIYLFTPDGRASLVSRSGVPESSDIAAETSQIELAARLGLGASDGWERMELVPAPAFVDWPAGPWDRRANELFVVPIRHQGQSYNAAGVFIAGVNPYRQVDDKYRSFVHLFVGQVTAGLANVRAYEEERRRAEALAELDRAKTAFFSNVSHEFRTPLTLMLGPTEDARNAADRALRGEDLETVYRNEVRLLKLVNTLLDFSRIEAGRMQAHFQPVDLATLTADLAGVFRSAVERGGLQLHVDCPPLPEPVYVDREMWEKVVLNLLSNAFKFTFDGEIRVALRLEGGRAVLRVADTGVGMAPDELSRVFERFHRVEGSRARTHEGSGIGLALVHDLVQLHGGAISVDSEPGRGTTFTVAMQTGHAHLPADRIGVLPAASPASATGAAAYVAEAERWLPEASSSPPAVEAERVGGATSIAAVPGRVLVADDNADMRDYAARLLRPFWEVETVADGQQALDAIRRRRPDLVLTDIMMPTLDGLGLLSSIRTDPALVHLPVIMLSARAGAEAQVEGLEAGADDYLVKPFSARELIARVATHLGLGRARHQAVLERDRFRNLLRDLPAIVNFLSGPDLVFEFAHPLTIQALGGRDIVGKPVLEAIPELNGQPYVDMLREVYRSGRIVSGRTARARLDRANDGTLQDSYWDFTYLPVRSQSGAIEGVMTFDLDVTDKVVGQRRLEEHTAALESARDRLEQATRAKDEFLAMLGHELRNPLAPILTALQLMQLKGAPEIEKERRIIERQTKHLVRLVDDLLDVSRIARGKIDLKKERVQVATVVARAIELASPLLESRGQALDIDVPHTGLPVDADPSRLAQAIANLLTNAAKYSERTGRITIRAYRTGDDVSIAVRDDGIGIEPAMLPRIFDMFVQERQALDRSQGGLGLGLTIVQSILSLHGGSASATSAGPGKGSEFVLRMPAAVETPAGVPGPGARPRALAAATGGTDVLIVDDNDDAGALMAEALEQKGHRVRIAADGPSALKLLAEVVPAVALLDIGLPGMDGYELAAHIRADSKLSRLRLLALTGYGQPSDRQRTADAGFDGHMVKPVDVDELDRVLRSLVGRAGAARR